MSHRPPARERRSRVVWGIVLFAAAAASLPLLIRAARRYGPAARVSEARGRIAFLLTAARSYAEEHESDNDPATADWPDSCGAQYFPDDCAETENFTYSLTGARNSRLVIRAVGKSGGRQAGVVVELSLTDPRGDGTLLIQRGGQRRH